MLVALSLVYYIHLCATLSHLFSFLYIIISLFTLLLMNGIHKAYFIDIINDLKIFMLFILFSSVNLNSNDIKNIDSPGSP